MAIYTYFVGQDVVPDIYVPIANLVPSDDGCGLFRYSISGDVNGMFHIKDNQLFLTKVPPSGTHDINIEMQDPLNRFSPVGNNFSLTVGSHYCAIYYLTTTTTPSPSTTTTTTLSPAISYPSINSICVERSYCGYEVYLGMELNATWINFLNSLTYDNWNMDIQTSLGSLYGQAPLQKGGNLFDYFTLTTCVKYQVYSESFRFRLSYLENNTWKTIDYPWQEFIVEGCQ